MIKMFIILLTLNTGFISSVFASAWIGCDACMSDSTISPSCNMCGSSPALTAPPWASPTLTYCPSCGGYVPTTNFTSMQPWWMNASPYYSNFYGPAGFYNGFGMQPNYFPMPQYFPSPQIVQPNRGGGMYMDKPVLYLRGPAKAKVQVTLSMGGGKDSNSEVLVAVPALTESKGVSSWDVELNQNSLKTTEGNYDFLFYDAWADDSIFQDKRGYCGDRKEILSYMKSGLKQRKFPEESIVEFEATWNVKLPFNQNLCVYPQTERELQNGVKISFEPKNVELVQLEYLVIPKPYFTSDESKTRTHFSQAPLEDFQEFKEGSLISKLEVASQDSKNSIHAYDWGVGFLRLNSKK